MNGFNLVKEIGRSFIISSFIPAALFVLVLMLLFGILVPAEVMSRFGEMESLLVIFGTSFAIFTIWLSLILYSSVDWIINVFAGYYLPGFLSNLLQFLLLRNVRRKTHHIQSVRQILNTKVSERTDTDEEDYQRMWSNAVAELNYTGWLSPSEGYLIMPTRFGNILSANSEYALDRYRIEQNQIWPRLRDLLPEKFLKSMEEKNNHLVFLLNSALLIDVIGVVGIIAAITVGLFEWFHTPALRQNNFVVIPPGAYLIISLIALTIGYLLYRVAISTALEFFSFYKTGIDLYRLELLKNLHYPPPQNLRQEQNYWLEISTFFIAGEKLDWNPDTSGMRPYYYYQGEEKPEPIRLRTRKKTKS